MAQKRAFTIEDVYRSQYVGAPQLSPDGTRLVFTTTQQSLPAQSSKTNLVLMETGKNGTTRTLTTDGMSFGPQWSSDGKSLYYTGYATGTAQLYRMDPATGETTQLTDFAMGVGDALVSPDGRYVAFTATVYPDLGADAKANLERKQERGGTCSRSYCRQPALPPLDGISGRTLPAHHRLRPARQDLHGRDARHVAFTRLLAQRRRGTLRLLARQQGDLLHLESGPPPGGIDQLRPLDGLRYGRRGKMSDQGEPGMGRTAALFARRTLHRLPLPDRAQL